MHRRATKILVTAIMLSLSACPAPRTYPPPPPPNECHIEVSGAVNETGACSASLLGGLAPGVMYLNVSLMLGMFQRDPAVATASAEMITASLSIPAHFQPGTWKLITLEAFEKSPKGKAAGVSITDMRAGFGFRRYGQIERGTLTLTALEPYQGSFEFTAKRTRLPSTPPLSPQESRERVTVKGRFKVH